MDDEEEAQGELYSSYIYKVGGKGRRFKFFK